MARISSAKSELIEGNGYEGRQTSKGELFVKVFGMSRDCEGAHIHFKMAASVRACSNDRGFSKFVEKVMFF